MTLTFRPDMNGQANITVQARDTANAVATDTFSVTVNPVNDNPRAVADQGTTNEDAAISNVNVLANDSDIDLGDVLNVVGVQGTTLLTGTSARGAAISLNANGVLTYDPTKSTALQALKPERNGHRYVDLSSQRWTRRHRDR